MWFKRKPAPEPTPLPAPTMPVFPEGYTLTVRKSTAEEIRANQNQYEGHGPWFYRYRVALKDETGREKDTTGIPDLSDDRVIRAANNLYRDLMWDIERQAREAKYLGDYPPKTIPLTKEEA